jgi:flagellar biosynthetic protein FlhB
MAEKTEQPTQKKLREARRRGEVPRSRELGTAAVLLAAAAALTATAGHLLASLVGVFDLSLAAVAHRSAASPTALLEAAAALGLDALVPLLVAVVAAGALAAFLQVGPLLTVEPLTPKLERIDPFRGVGRLFSQRRLVELLKATLALLIVAAVAWLTLRDGLRGVLGLVARDAEAAIAGTGGLVGRLLLRVGAAVAAVTARTRR